MSTGLLPEKLLALAEGRVRARKRDKSSDRVRAIVDDFVRSVDHILNQRLDAVSRAIAGRGSMRSIAPPLLVDGVPVAPGDVAFVRIAPVERAHGSRLAKPVRAPRKRISCLKPHCPNVAAPIYGMVCVRHKDEAPRLIAAWRAARAARRE